jgi:hypothetical protein
MITEDDDVNSGGKGYPLEYIYFPRVFFALLEINLEKVKLSQCTS